MLRSTYTNKMYFYVTDNKSETKSYIQKLLYIFNGNIPWRCQLVVAIF